MAGDLPPESDDDLTGIVRGDIGEPLPLSSLDLAPQPDLVASLSPWQSPLRQASLAALPRAVSPAPLSAWESPLRQAVNASQNASQLRGSSARGLPSGDPTRAAEPEKPVTPGFAVWRSPAMFGSPRVQSDAEAPSPPVVSGVQDGLVRRATQTASRAVLGAGAVDGLLATRNEKKPTPREPWQEPLVTGSTCSGKTNTMDWSASLAEWDATASCGCSSCGGPSVPETRKDAVEINLHAGAKSNDWMSTFTSQNICPLCGSNKSHEEFHRSDFYKKNILGTFRRFVNMGGLFSAGDENCMDVASYNPPAALAEIEKFKPDTSQKNFDSSDNFNFSPNAQPNPPGGTENYISNLFKTNSIVNDPGMSLRHVHGVVAEKNIRGKQEKFRTIFTKDTKKGGQSSSIVYKSKEQDELWKFGVVKYFFFDPNDYGYSQMNQFTKWPPLEKNLVLRAMEEWEDITNGSIRFVEFPIGVQLMYGPNVVRGSSLATNLKVGPKPTNAQFLGTARHEFGHIIGLAHEQQRDDLSTFVQVRYTPPEEESEQYIPSQNIIGPFNPRSVMMYGSTLQSCLIKGTNKACYLCQPQWIGGNGTTVPDRLFCPFPFAPNAYVSQYVNIKNEKIDNLKIKNGVMSGGYLPNQPYSIIPDPDKFLTLLDGSGVIELYRWAYYNIIPFFPLFDHFKNSPDLGSQAEYLTNGDSINNVNSNSPSAFINNTQIFGSPSVVYADNGDIFVVVTAKNSQIYVRRYDSKTKNWNPKWDHISSNFPIFSEPTAVISDGILVIFATDTKGVIRFCGMKMIQSLVVSTKWFSVNINMSTTQRQLARPAVVRNPNGGFEIFAYTPGIFSFDGYPSLTTCHVSTNNDQVQITGLQKISGLFFPTSSPAAAIAQDGSIVISIFGFDGTTNTVDINNQKDVSSLENPNNTGESVWVRTGLFSSNETNPIIWNAWDNLPGQVHLAGSNPTIGISNNKFSIYVRGKYGHLIRRWFSTKKGWDDFWWDLGGILASDPNAAKNQIFALTGENLNDYFSPVTSDPSPEGPISTLEQNLINAGAVEPRALKIVSVNDITTLNLGIWYKQDNLDDSVLPFDLEGGGGFL